MMLKLIRNGKGVTLFEILAVVVILGIIAAVAVPTIGNLIENQSVNAAKTEWDNINEAARLYALDDNNDIDGDNQFSLTELIDSDYLTNFDSEITIHSYDLFGRPARSSDNSVILFDSSTGEFLGNPEAITINGILIEGELPTRDNRVIF